MREITISLPDCLEINGAKDAPSEYRMLNTENWDEGFLLTALAHGVSQKLGDVWSVNKKDVNKLASAHAALEAGDWNQRTVTNPVAKINSLIGKLSPAQLAELKAALG